MLDPSYTLHLITHYRFPIMERRTGGAMRFDCAEELSRGEMAAIFYWLRPIAVINRRAVFIGVNNGRRIQH